MQLTRTLLISCYLPVALWTATSIAEQASLPYVSSIRSVYRVARLDVAQEWHTTGGKTTRPIDAAELDTTCAELIKSTPTTTNNGKCYLAIVAPSTDSNGNERYEMLLNRYELWPTFTVRDALKHFNPTGVTSNINPGVNGYVYREGRGCMALTTNAPRARMPEGSSAGGLSPLVPELNGLLSGTCVGVTPLEEWCAMETREAEFNFGTLNISSWSGQRLTKAINVQCTGSVKYQLRTGSGARSISLSNGGLAKLDVDGGWGQTVQGVAGTNTHTLGVELTEPPLTSGPYNGSEVISVSYP